MSNDFGLGDFGGNESDGVEEVVVSLRSVRRFLRKTLPVTSGPLWTVNHALCRSASAQPPQLPPQLERQYTTYPRRWDHPGGIWGHTHTSTEKQISMCSYNRKPPQSSTCRADIHVYKPTCLSSGCEVGRFAAAGVRGHRNFTTSGGFSGFSRWDLNTTKGSQLPLWQVSKDV